MKTRQFIIAAAMLAVVPKAISSGLASAKAATCASRFGMESLRSMMMLRRLSKSRGTLVRVSILLSMPRLFAAMPVNETNIPYFER